jgi:HAD superfamily phosphatase (TIGR01668 family)
MFDNLFPDEYLSSAYGIDYDRLYAEGYRGVIYDIDNTLVPHGAPADNRALALFRHLHELGMQAVFLSNNGEPRVKKFSGIVQEQYIFKAGKPSPGGYRAAMKMMGTDEKNTFVVGDQIFTDIWGAKRAGLRAILVKPIHPTEEIQIVVKRLLEKPVLACYRNRCRKEPGNGLNAGRYTSAALPLIDGREQHPYGEYSGKPGCRHPMQD